MDAVHRPVYGRHMPKSIVLPLPADVENNPWQLGGAVFLILESPTRQSLKLVTGVSTSLFSDDAELTLHSLLVGDTSEPLEKERLGTEEEQDAYIKGIKERAKPRTIQVSQILAPYTSFHYLGGWDNWYWLHHYNWSTVKHNTTGEEKIILHSNHGIRLHSPGQRYASSTDPSVRHITLFELVSDWTHLPSTTADKIKQVMPNATPEVASA